MSALIYKGTSQPAVTSGGGILDSLGLFGDSTPAYAGNGQPSSASSNGLFGGLLGGSTPAYRSAPAPSQSPNVATSPSQDVDPDPFPQGPFAILIPRQS